eukprot:3105241-Amphidinium_carterae.1
MASFSCASAPTHCAKALTHAGLETSFQQGLAVFELRRRVLTTRHLRGGDRGLQDAGYVACIVESGVLSATELHA